MPKHGSGRGREDQGRGDARSPPPPAGWRRTRPGGLLAPPHTAEEFGTERGARLEPRGSEGGVERSQLVGNRVLLLRISHALTTTQQGACCHGSGSLEHLAGVW